MEYQLDLEHRVTENEARSKSNEKRIAKLEETTEAIHSMALSLERMTNNQETMNKTLTKLTGEVETIKAEPAKKWRFVVEKALYFIVGGIMAVILAKVGLS